MTHGSKQQISLSTTWFFTPPAHTLPQPIAPCSHHPHSLGPLSEPCFTFICCSRLMECPIKFASEPNWWVMPVRIFHHHARVIFQWPFAFSPDTIIGSLFLLDFLVHVFIWGLASVSHGYFPQVSADPRLSAYI